jgi:hypothetical protein
LGLNTREASYRELRAEIAGHIAEVMYVELMISRMYLRNALERPGLDVNVCDPVGRAPRR